MPLMPTLAEQIEEYIRELIRRRPDGVVEIQRSELAMRFGCVPSQISYVLERRFTPERGYLVESRRGGRGYIRIIRLTMEPEEGWQRLLVMQIGEAIDQERAEAIVARLLEEGKLTCREAALLRAAMRREVLGVGLPQRDQLRARLLKHMLAALWRAQAEERQAGPAAREGAPS